MKPKKIEFDGQQLKKIIKGTGFTQEKLGRRVALHKVSISRIISENRIFEDDLINIARVLDVCTESLLPRYKSYKSKPYEDDERKLYIDGEYIPPFKYSLYKKGWINEYRDTESKFWDWLYSTDLLDCMRGEYYIKTGKEITNEELKAFFCSQSLFIPANIINIYESLQAAVRNEMLKILFSIYKTEDK